MRIAVFGLGYVGSVSAVCLAELGHEVVGIDIKPEKVAALGNAESPIVEPGLEDRLREVVAAGRLSTTVDAATAVRSAEASLVCVGTPFADGRGVVLDHLARVCDEIGAALQDADFEHTVVVRSTVPPGTCESLVVPALEDHLAGKRVKATVFYHPEFLREGSAVADFYQPEMTVVAPKGQASRKLAASLYPSITSKVHTTDFTVAEMLKYVNNSFHGLKVAYANEIGRLCAKLGVDAVEVMELFRAETKLNVSAAYLRPGFAFGGSCLPKEIRALATMGVTRSVETPVVDSILDSNDAHIRVCADRIVAMDAERLLFLGAAFKGNTGDVRESPALAVLSRIVNHRGSVSGIRLYDPHVTEQDLRAIAPNLSSTLTHDVQRAAMESDAVILATNHREFADLPMNLRTTQIVLDLVGSPAMVSSWGGTYEFVLR